MKKKNVVSLIPQVLRETCYFNNDSHTTKLSVLWDSIFCGPWDTSGSTSHNFSFKISLPNKMSYLQNFSINILQ